MGRDSFGHRARGRKHLFRGFGEGTPRGARIVITRPKSRLERGRESRARRVAEGGDTKTSWAALACAGATSMGVGSEGCVAGIVAVADTVRAETREAISELSAFGDRESRAGRGAIRKAVDLMGFRCEVSPPSVKWTA